MRNPEKMKKNEPLEKNEEKWALRKAEINRITEERKALEKTRKNN